MKPAISGDYDPKARRIDRDAACPQCQARAQVFADGAVLCVMEGGISFVPDEDDVELFAMQMEYRARQATLAEAKPGLVAWLPKRAIGTTWAEIEEKLGLKCTGNEGTEMQSACEVILPSGWSIVRSDVSIFQHWLIDTVGVTRAKLFYKEYSADYMELV